MPCIPGSLKKAGEAEERLTRFFSPQAPCGEGGLKTWRHSACFPLYRGD